MLIFNDDLSDIEYTGLQYNHAFLNMLYETMENGLINWF